jgi:DNA-binding NtrC family response regulator
MDASDESEPPEPERMVLDDVPLTKLAYVSGRPTAVHLRMCKLVLERDDGTPAEYIFDQPTVAIGGMEDNDIVIADDTVSRYHCRIEQEETGYTVRDLDSTNGTFVNRVRVREAFLKPGCQLTVGKSELRFETLDERVEIQPANRDNLGRIVGKSLRMREIFGVLEKIGPTGATVIIEGETGTGKEVVARTIHEASRRADKPFVVFDCGAVPANLIESELFGHEKGSFTGAIMARQGLFETAQGGSIFLDELGELSLDLQPKLLRALEQREIRRVGSNKSIKIDVRVVAATNRNLHEEVKAGRFREDLYYRLSVVRVILPPLRDRMEDIPLLVKHFLHRGNFNRDAAGNVQVKGVSRDALDCLVNYHWPGNVRELLNVVERACAYSDGDYVQAEDLPEHISGIRIVRRKRPVDTTAKNKVEKELEKPFKEAKEAWISNFEKDYVLALLRKNSYNISHASREADIDRKYFRKLMKKYEIACEDDEDEKEGA